MLFQIMSIAGITGLIFLVLIFLSCVCMGSRFFRHFAQNKFLLKLRPLHCWFWWGLFVSMLVHTGLAFYLFGLPF